MNAQQLRTIMWLRWRIRVNQLKRGGALNAVILAIASVALVFLAIGLFVGSFLLGLFVLADASPLVLLFVWDGLVAAFLIFWMAGLFSELQRSESVALEKFLHLPVSLSGAFLINYLSSLLSVNLLVFLPPMIGLSLALIIVKGPAMLSLLPLLAAFLLMVTALTYQFQGWLAALMVNKRRRRTIIVVATMTFVLMCQVPNLLNVFHPWDRGQRLTNERNAARIASWNREQNELKVAFETHQITPAQYQQRLEELLRKNTTPDSDPERMTDDQIAGTARLINLCLPPGWLPYGAMTSAEGNVAPALLGILGLSLIGVLSLWRSYRTTLRLYTGQYTSIKKEIIVAAPAPKTGAPTTHLLERRLPLLSEHVSAIAVGSFRSLTRAPEAKMMLLSPILLVVIFGSMLLTQPVDMPQMVRPLLAFGAMSMILFGMIQLIGNQFGFDRSGFRVFVLCPARRRDILLGKNLAVAPLALGLGLIVVGLLEIIRPMRVDHFLAVLPQMLSMYMLFCLLANFLSILAPMPIASGSLKPVNPKMIPILLHLAFVFLMPIILAPTLIPLGVEFALDELGGIHGLPVYLGLSLLECAAVAFLYRLVVTWQGELLQGREQRILEIVAANAE